MKNRIIGVIRRIPAPQIVLRSGLLAVAMGLLLTGPAAAQQPSLQSLPTVPEPAAPPQPQLQSLPATNQYRLTAIRIDDARSNASERTINLGRMTGPGRGDKVWPVLTTAQRERITAALQAHFQADSTRPTAVLQCRIVDAYQMFMPTTQTAYIFGYAQLELELLDGQGELLMAATGEFVTRRAGFGVGYKGLEICFQTALDEAVQLALAHLTRPAD